MIELTYPGLFATDSTATSLYYVNGEKINALIVSAKKSLGEMGKLIFTNVEDHIPSSEVCPTTDGGMGIDMPYNALMNDTTISKPIAIDNDNKRPGKRVSLAEAYEQVGRIYENAEVQRQVLREQEARLFFGLLGD